MQYQAFDFQQKLDLINQHWTAKVIVEMNDDRFKPFKIRGDFIGQDHPVTDEILVVLDDRLRIDWRDGYVDQAQDGRYVVARGVIETGAKGGQMTAVNDGWI